jgi:hypothetical protein
MATNYVANSSNSILLDALRSLSKHQFPKERIIGPRNKYKESTITKTNHITFASGNIDIPQISQYIASSVIAHCYDGWNFLSRGIDALLSGDISTAVHLFYYSELRAVMSIMAFEGIGIFDKKHIYFDSAKVEHVFKKNVAGEQLTTHKAADELIIEWASLNSKKNIVFKSINVNNRSLNEWVNASGHSATSGYASSVVNDWFKSWSIDLKLNLDQKLRNEMSYRPHFNINGVNIHQKINQLIQIWEGLEPTDSNRFIELDMHLLRITIEQLFKRITGKTTRDRSYLIFVNHIFDSLGESKSQILYNFILRLHNREDHILISEAKKDLRNPEINYKDPIPMICRSILLLRFATGCTNFMIIDSGLNHSDLKFWWEEFAYKAGITNSNPSGIDPIDLYIDVSDSVSKIKSYSNLLTNIKQTNLLGLPDLCNLKQFQRVCFWGMGL